MPLPKINVDRRRRLAGANLDLCYAIEKVEKKWNLTIVEIIDLLASWIKSMTRDYFRLEDGIDKPDEEEDDNDA
jgi:hypothetical protein